MADSRDKFDAEALPDPELNPLLNPLLAAHMGRWAEVYFTNPPEKRGQAVTDLLRELQSSMPPESVAVQPVKVQSSQAERREEKLRIVEQQQEVATETQQNCEACSASNAAGQKFCGMCGAPLPPSTAQMKSRFPAAEPISNAHWDEPESDLSDSEQEAEPPRTSTRYVGRETLEPEWSIADADLPHFAQESESVPYRYRLYVGIVLALLLGALVYLGWHRTAANSGDASESIPARVIPAAPAAETAASPQKSAAPRNVLPTERSTASAAPPVSEPARRPVESQNQPETGVQKSQPRSPRAASPRIVQVAAGSAALANEQNGAEELATAEKYLSGNQGMARDNREAAQWLWKAVGKGNLAATMVLSDLYLRGDGVAKSCDQARLLLDAAAKKGKASAAQRLRNLQAFGCQ